MKQISKPNRFHFDDSFVMQICYVTLCNNITDQMPRFHFAVLL